MDRRALVGLVLAAGALVGGVAAFSLTAPPPAPVPVPRIAGHAEAAKPQRTPAAAPTNTENRVAPGVNLEAGGSAADAGRAAPGIDDDPVLRKALERQATLAAPYWAKIAPRISDPDARARAAAMIERLRVLKEPATIVAHEQYALTQRLITTGGFDRPTQAALDYVNSTAAAVLQNGDPDDVPTPEESATFKPRPK